MQVIYCGYVTLDAYSGLFHNNKHILYITKNPWRTSIFEFSVCERTRDIVAIHHTEDIKEKVVLPLDSPFILNDLAYLDASFTYGEIIYRTTCHCFITWDIPFYTLVSQLIHQLYIKDVANYIFWLYFQTSTTYFNDSKLKCPIRFLEVGLKKYIIPPHIQSLRLIKKNQTGM